MDTYPYALVIGGIIFLVVSVLWFGLFLRRVDPWLRVRIGERYGVTIRIGGRGMWQVVERGQGMRGFLIEMRQPLFLIPWMLLPLIVYMILMLLLGQG